VAIVGEVARNYFELRGLQERLRVARDNAENQRETLRLVRRASTPAAAPSSTPRGARAQLEPTLALGAGAWRPHVAVTEHRIAVLTGARRKR
jgi:outer membrane protein TolC